MVRKRRQDGTFEKAIKPGDILEVFDEVRGPVITSSDVAEALDCSSETARRELRALAQEGTLSHRTTGRVTVWWLADEEETDQ